MSDVDTSAEAQHWIGMAPDWAGSPATEGEPGLRAFLRSGGATMKALLDQRDALTAAIEEQRHAYHGAHIAMEAQRDAARAEAARLRDALEQIKAQPMVGPDAALAYANGHDVARLYAADIASAALAAKEPGHE